MSIALPALFPFNVSADDDIGTVLSQARWSGVD